jgi:hypothetical protein
MPEKPAAPSTDPAYDDLPVVGFLRLAGWSEERIAEVVAAHRRGETPTYSVTLARAEARDEH